MYNIVMHIYVYIQKYIVYNKDHFENAFTKYWQWFFLSIFNTELTITLSIYQINLNTCAYTDTNVDIDMHLYKYTRVGNAK